MSRIAFLTAIAFAAMSGAAMAQTPAPKSPGPAATPSPTVAKSQTECETSWKAADKNSDGRLDTAELSAAKASMPASLASKTAVMQREYVTACTSGK